MASRKPSGPFDSFLETVRTYARVYEPGVRHAIEKLCQKGKSAGKDFDQKKLAKRLDKISTILIAPRPDPLGYRAGETGQPFRKDTVRLLAKQAAAFRKRISEFKQTRLAVHLAETNQISTHDLLHPAQSLTAFDAVVKLPSLLSTYENTLAPLVDPHVLDLCKYVKETTDGWNDQLLIEILAPLKVAHTGSLPAFRKWRTRK